MLEKWTKCKCGNAFGLVLFEEVWTCPSCLINEIMQLRKLRDAVKSRHMILMELGPDFSGADGDLIYASWLEDLWAEFC